MGKLDTHPNPDTPASSLPEYFQPQEVPIVELILCSKALACEQEPHLTAFNVGEDRVVNIG